MLVVNKLREAVDDGVSALRRRVRRRRDVCSSTGSRSASRRGFRPYWGQREAIETLAYLVEVEQCRDVQALIETYHDVPDPNLIEQGISFQTTPDGVRQVLRRRGDGGIDTINLPDDGLARFAMKMATGSGKTLVMALVTVWSYFHPDARQTHPCHRIS